MRRLLHIFLISFSTDKPATVSPSLQDLGGDVRAWGTKMGHANLRPNNVPTPIIPAVTPPFPKDLGHDVKAWGKKYELHAVSTAALNNVESLSANPRPPSFITIVLKSLPNHGSRIPAQPTTWTRPLHRDSSNCIIPEDGRTTRLKILEKGTVRRWIKSANGHAPVEMEIILHVHVDGLHVLSRVVIRDD